jgi:nucleoside-diphosphate-sugar epimerase
MRIFLAGATGVIGIRLLPLLVSAAHTHRLEASNSSTRRSSRERPTDADQ